MDRIRPLSEAEFVSAMLLGISLGPPTAKKLNGVTEFPMPGGSTLTIYFNEYVLEVWMHGDWFFCKTEDGSLFAIQPDHKASRYPFDTDDQPV